MSEAGSEPNGAVFHRVPLAAAQQSQEPERFLQQGRNGGRRTATNGGMLTALAKPSPIHELSR